MSSDKPIFISYAPEDLPAAQRVADALRESGIQARVEDTKSGDLKAEIEGSALFLAIISQNAKALPTGNFRNEWEIAAEFMDTLPRGVPFLLPIIVDDTDEYGIETPSAFGGVHWISQPDGDTSAELVEEVVRLLTIPRGPVYFPPIPPGLSRPPFSMKKKTKTNKLPAKKPSPPWLMPTLVGVAVLLLASLGFLMFTTPSYENVQPTAPEDNPVLADEPVAEVEAPPPTPPPEPEPLTDDAIWAAYNSARLTHNYAAAAESLTEWMSRQPQVDLELRLELVWVEFTRDLNPDNYLDRVTQLSSERDGAGEKWLPPVAYGLNRDFANQRRAIRGGAGAITIDFAADASKAEIALTESYMDQGNWALARHYGNQARNALEDSLSAAATGPVLNGQFEAFMAMTRRNPESIAMLETLLSNHEEGREVTERLLIRALIDQDKPVRALELIAQALRQPSLLDPASVLFLPPYDLLHQHPTFRTTLEAHVAPEIIDAAITWVADRKSGAQSRMPVF